MDRKSNGVKQPVPKTEMEIKYITYITYRPPGVFPKQFKLHLETVEDYPWHHVSLISKEQTRKEAKEGLPVFIEEALTRIVEYKRDNRHQ